MTSLSNKPPNTNTPPAIPTQPASAMTYAQVQDIWIQAGGSPQSSSMAAAVASAESGLNPNAKYTNPDGSTGVGLWLIDPNGIPPGSTDPLANARAAVQQSKNGTDWSQWCSTWSDNSCGSSQGTYLGDGSNALAALQGTFNQSGAAPTGNGTSASTASSTSVTPQSSTSTGSKALLIIGVLIVALALFFITRRQRAKEGGTNNTVETSATTEET